MFALSTDLLPAIPEDADPAAAVAAFGRRVLDEGATGVTIESGLPSALVRALLELLPRDGCNVAAMATPSPRPAMFDRVPQELATLSLSDIEPARRAVAERALLSTIDLASDNRITLVTAELGRVADVPALRVEQAGEPHQADPARGWAHHALELREPRAKAAFDAARRSLDAGLRAAERRGITLCVAIPRDLPDLPSFRELETLQESFRGAPMGVWLDSEAIAVLDRCNVKRRDAWTERFAESVRGAWLRDAAQEFADPVLPGEGVIDFADLRRRWVAAKAIGPSFVGSLRIRETDSGLTRNGLEVLRRAGWSV